MPVVNASAVASGSARTAAALASRLVRAFDLLSPVAPRVPGLARKLLPASAPAVAVPPRDDAAPQSDASEVVLLRLEGPTGTHVGRAFSIRNDRSERVNARIRLSTFDDGAGHTASPAVSITPASLDLEAGEYAVVQVSTVLGEDFEAGVLYTAQISIPGLTERTLPLTARRSDLRVA